MKVIYKPLYEQNRIEQNGIEQNKMKWYGMEQNRTCMEQNRTEQNRVEQNKRGYKAKYNTILIEHSPKGLFSDNVNINTNIQLKIC